MNNKDEVLELTDNEKAYELLDQAHYAKTEKLAIEYAKKAIKLKKDFTDAKLFLLTFEDNYSKREKTLLNIINEAKGLLLNEEINENDEDYHGIFYGLLETRPYMRSLYDLVELYIEEGKFKKAIEECKHILNINKNDNLGVRYKLLGLYALFEEEKEAEKVFKEYGEYSLATLLPMLVIYYKSNNIKKGKEFLKNIKSCNEYIYPMLTLSKEFSEKELIKLVSSDCYSRNSKEEAAIFMIDLSYVLITCNGLNDWILSLE